MGMIKENYDLNQLKNFGFLERADCYYMYNPLWENLPKRIEIDKSTRRISIVGGMFEKAEQVIKKMQEAEIIIESGGG
ncbi:MAG: hypothetical protein IJH12_07005 [Clostridia bacterium]|nr:hypothetical protein [Clostridia bacterium]